MTKRERRIFTPGFKKQMVQLYQNEKTKRAIIDEYDLTPSALDRWIHQDEISGSFKERDNRTPEQQELLELRKELKQLRMENDILKQAALIMKRNKDKYSVSAMCSVLQISRSTYYYEAKERQSEDDITGAVIEIFEQNRSAYDTRKIKVELHKRGFTVSRRRIGRI